MTTPAEDHQERKVVRAEYATRVFVVLVAALLAVTAYGVFLVRQQQVNNISILDTTKSAAKSAATTAKAVESCTTPGESCYQRSQKRTGQAVANINRVVILAAACAVGQHGTVAEIQNAIQVCVINRLAADQRGNP